MVITTTWYYGGSIVNKIYLFCILNRILKLSLKNHWQEGGYLKIRRTKPLQTSKGSFYLRLEIINNFELWINVWQQFGKPFLYNPFELMGFVSESSVLPQVMSQGKYFLFEQDFKVRGEQIFFKVAERDCTVFWLYGLLDHFQGYRYGRGNTGMRWAGWEVWIRAVGVVYVELEADLRLYNSILSAEAPIYFQSNVALHFVIPEHVLETYSTSTRGWYYSTVTFLSN